MTNPIETNPMDLLLLADEDEDTGAWELATWRRMTAAYSYDRSLSIVNVGGVYVFLGTIDLAYLYIVRDQYDGLVCVRQDRWSWYHQSGWKKWSSDKKNPGHCSLPRPLWVQKTLEEAGRMAVAQVLKRRAQSK